MMEKEKTSSEQKRLDRYELERLIQHIEAYPDSRNSDLTIPIVQRLQDELRKVKLYEYISCCPGVSLESEVMTLALSSVEGHNVAEDETSLESSGYSSSSSLLVDEESKEDVEASSRRKKGRKWSRFWCLVWLWDGLLVVSLLLMMCSLGAWSYYDKYWIPWMQNVLQFTDDREVSEYTYYDQKCGVRDMSSTTFTLDDMKVSLVEEARSIQEEHGITYYPKVLSDETASRMRDFVLKRNAELSEEDAIWLISQRNRWSFYIGLEDDLVWQLMSELANHPILAPSMKAIMKGEEPALVELTAITSAYGAEDQHWHVDTRPSDVHYANAFVPMYSLFVPLQDTNEDMGPTDVCPGTHVCSDSDNLTPWCDGVGRMRIAPMSAGDAMLMHLHTWHRGPAHTDPTPNHERVMLIITFSPQPPSAVTKQISLGTSYSLRWDIHGYLLSDFRAAVNAHPSKATNLGYIRNVFKSVGLTRTNNRGWTYLTVIASRIIHDQFGFRYHDLTKWIDSIHRPQTNRFVQYVAGYLPENVTGQDDNWNWIDYLYHVLQTTFITLRNLYIGLIVGSTLLSLLCFLSSLTASSTTTLCRPFVHLTLIGLSYHFIQTSVQRQVDTIPSQQHNSHAFTKSYNPIFAALLQHPKDPYATSSTAMPTRESILLPSRTDSLGFHRANHKLQTTLSSLPIHSLSFFPLWLEHALDKQQVVLHQNLQTGDWHVTNYQNSFEWCKWKWLQIHNFLPPLQQNSPILSLSPHSHLFTKDLMKLILPNSPNEHDGVILPFQKQSIPTQQWKQPCPTNFMATPKPSTTHVDIRSKQPYNALPSKAQENNNDLFKVGDYVEQYVEGDEGWFRGQIAGFYYEHNEFNDQMEQLIQIQFDDGVFDDGSTVDDVRPFQPYVQGELVWITWPHEEESGDKVIDTVGIIQQVKANLHFHVADANDPETIFEDMPIYRIRRYH